MFEFFLCPQHGLFRPENLAMIMSYASGVWTEMQHLWFLAVNKCRR